MPATTTPATRRQGRLVALLVGGVWIMAGLPVALGLASCPTARFLHVPCPGCGTTRALSLLARGEIGASLALHPLAVPTASAQLLFAAASVLATMHHGTPFATWRTKYGRASIYALAAVFVVDVLLWLARAAGFFGGPVQV